MQRTSVEQNTKYFNTNSSWVELSFPEAGGPSPGALTVSSTASSRISVSYFSDAAVPGSKTCVWAGITRVQPLPVRSGPRTPKQLAGALWADATLETALTEVYPFGSCCVMLSRGQRSLFYQVLGDVPDILISESLPSLELSHILVIMRVFAKSILPKSVASTVVKELEADCRPVRWVLHPRKSSFFSQLRATVKIKKIGAGRWISSASLLLSTPLSSSSLLFDGIILLLRSSSVVRRWGPGKRLILRELRFSSQSKYSPKLRAHYLPIWSSGRFSHRIIHIHWRREDRSLVGFQIKERVLHYISEHLWFLSFFWAS